jgi:heat shock protein HtpX
MPNLYTQAESNVRKTFLFMTFFLIFVILIGWLLSQAFDSYFPLIIAVVYSVFQSFISYWYSDKIILSRMKAIPVTQENAKELYRIVENLCITAGLPVPKIYILDEMQPNAFATGRDANHAVIVFTRGLLEKLERSEIEGVAAHELSHIGNKDMLLQTVTVTLVGVIALLSRIFLRFSFWGGGDDRGGEGYILFFLGIIGAILAPIVAMLIQFAISRKREFLADATGALLTRYPEGLARALEKISKDQEPLKVATTSNAHLFIANPFRGRQQKSFITKLFMTHPPIEERIKALLDMKVG